MSGTSQAAKAIIEALKDPALTADQRHALLQSLDTLMGNPEANAPTLTAPTAPKNAGALGTKAATVDRVALTKPLVASLALPASGERLVYDKVCPQLAVRLRPGGRSYVVVTWDKMRRRSVKMTLGKTDKLTPELARKAAQQRMGEMAAGKDLRRVATDDLTLSELIEKWHAEKSRSTRTADELRKKVIDYLGSLVHRLAGEVTPQDIGRIHHSVATEARKRVLRTTKQADGSRETVAVEIGSPGLPATADKWLATMHGIYAWAVRKGLAAMNPCTGIDKAYDAKGASRTNYLAGDALLHFWQALEADKDADARDAIKLMLYTGQRRGNILGMKWAAVDLKAGLWTLNASSTKQRAALTTPLVTQALEIVHARDASRLSQTWVFPATRGDGSMSETRVRDAWARICAAARIEDLHIHDLRHTSGSWMARLGANEAIRQKALGHATPAMAARYTHLELDPVADALQRVADAVTAAGKGQTASVSKLKRTK